MNPDLLLRTTWRHVLVIGALTFCAVAHCEPAATPEQKFSPGYLEACSTGYDNGQAAQAPTPDKTQAMTPGPLLRTSLVAQPPAPSSTPDKTKTGK
ncbi:hypothetical protein [Cupriavidus pinatubonensis]|uniref:hypothetical protein n=1 Tax=Cupriavidus pinatubonensis TaxID=248026 RepID=UPI001CC34A3B|nr:hypothetical protein [Cupriavidus pinatubonensis]